jgi:hypothetical protein
VRIHLNIYNNAPTVALTVRSIASGPSAVVGMLQNMKDALLVEWACTSMKTRGVCKGSWAYAEMQSSTGARAGYKVLSGEDHMRFRSTPPTSVR